MGRGQGRYCARGLSGSYDHYCVRYLDYRAYSVVKVEENSDRLLRCYTARWPNRCVEHEQEAQLSPRDRAMLRVN